MIKIVLYTENNNNSVTISSLMGKISDYSLSVMGYKEVPGKGCEPSDIDLLLLDLSGLSIEDSNLGSDIKKINEIFNKSPAGRILILDQDQQDYLFEDFLFTNDFLFIHNLKQEILPRISFLLYSMRLVLPADSLVVGDMILNMKKYELLVNGRVIVLTFKEFEMLKLLMQNRDRVFTRINLLSTVWGYDYYGGSRTVDVHMRRLRAKIPPPYNSMLKTIRNVGYMFSPE